MSSRAYRDCQNSHSLKTERDAMTDPRDLSPDQREFLDAWEQIARLPVPLVENDFEPLADHALDLVEARGEAIRGDDKLTIETLMIHEKGLRHAGHELAADGVQRVIDAYRAGVRFRAAGN
jgi:hypothetical protein